MIKINFIVLVEGKERMMLINVHKHEPNLVHLVPTYEGYEFYNNSTDEATELFFLAQKYNGWLHGAEEPSRFPLVEYKIITKIEYEKQRISLLDVTELPFEFMRISRSCPQGLNEQQLKNALTEIYWLHETS